jgi:hypothetical protein
MMERRIQLRHIVRTFVNVTVYLHYNNNMIIKIILKRGEGESPPFCWNLTSSLSSNSSELGFLGSPPL